LDLRDPLDLQDPLDLMDQSGPWDRMDQSVSASVTAVARS
jgi:hypothetical protein